MQTIKPDYFKIIKRSLLILCILCLSYCLWWIEAPSHIEQLDDDKYVGKTVLIYPTAGKFVLERDWYFGKRKGDSWFSSQRPRPDPKLPSKLYRIMGYYEEVYHGSGRIFVGNRSAKYLVEPVVGQINKRLFFSKISREGCEEQTNLIDPDTGIKIDLVCD
jgi:hypothetical protein